LGRQVKKDNYLRFYGRNCAEATKNSKSSGIYEILIPSYSEHSFSVACDADTRGGGWTVILSRLDGSENFYRGWNIYKKGFGNLDGEFFLGLDKIHALTSEVSMELLVILEDFESDIRYETYERFGISDEEEEEEVEEQDEEDEAFSQEAEGRTRCLPFDVYKLPTAGTAKCQSILCMCVCVCVSTLGAILNVHMFKAI